MPKATMPPQASVDARRNRPSSTGDLPSSAPAPNTQTMPAAIIASATNLTLMRSLPADKNAPETAGAVCSLTELRVAFVD